MYDALYLRPHPIHCLEKRRFTPFPRIETKAKLNKKKVTFIDVHCDCKCRLPNLLEEMVVMRPSLVVTVGGIAYVPV